MSSLASYFFRERVINPRNNLPSNADFNADYSSLAAFKRFILKVDFTDCLKRY